MYGNPDWAVAKKVNGMMGYWLFAKIGKKERASKYCGVFKATSLQLIMINNNFFYFTFFSVRINAFSANRNLI